MNTNENLDCDTVEVKTIINKQDNNKKDIDDTLEIKRVIKNEKIEKYNNIELITLTSIAAMTTIFCLGSSRIAWNNSEWVVRKFTMTGVYLIGALFAGTYALAGISDILSMETKKVKSKNRRKK